MRIFWGTLALLIGLAWLGIWSSLRKEETGPGPELELRYRETREPGARRIVLESASGRAVLVLDEPAGSSPGRTGRGRFEPTSVEEGGGFVRDLARWLGREPPAPAANGRLAAFPFRYKWYEPWGGRDQLSVFLSSAGPWAELRLEFEPGGERAWITERNEFTAANLCRTLADALRDGRPPRRSRAVDPDLASDEPIVTAATPLRCGGDVEYAVWTDLGFVGAVVVGGAPTRVVRWNDAEDRGTTMATFSAGVSALVPSPDGREVAATVCGSDGIGIMVMREPGRIPRFLAGTDADFPINLRSEVVWSPDGEYLAVSCPVPGAAREQGRVRVVDALSGAVRFETDAFLRVGIVRWSDDGLLLARTEQGPGEQATRVYFRWRSGEPIRSVEPPSWVSPDRAYRVTPLGDGTLRIRGPVKSLRYATALSDTQWAIRSWTVHGVDWCGPHHVLVDIEDPLLFDVAAQKMRLLLPDSGWTFLAASPDGRNLLCRAPDGSAYWARRD